MIEEQGRLNSIRKEKDLYTLNISAKVVLEGTKLGDSIATDGVCLTVTKLGGDYFEAEAMLETINNTTFKELKGGEILNLERALSPTKRLDGHIVQGHVDGVGKIINTTHNSNEIVYKISAEDDVLKYVVNKGSIALDGISLTVSKVDRNSLEVSIIPTTIRETNLKDKKLGDSINIETDIIGRYVYKFLNKEEKNSIDLEFLRENGF
ncbi:riboflavin synthase [Peptoniphilus duerdenii]|uniref:riboflavin synthase n=1 Tax=Peptoniphilus duerdenii TaxID=507750 RepID=UPI0032AFDA08